MKKSSYSVVIACNRADNKIPCLGPLLALPPADKPREIFVSVGKNPSWQRNLGVSACKSPFVYFLDDDSEVVPQTPRHLLSHFEDSRTAVAGGPNLCRPDASPFEKTVSAVLASWMGSFKVRTRYAALGSVKEATEKDLILCNLMVRRETFITEGGFRNDLFPNEENEFLNRLLHRQYRLVYDPRASIFRPRRKDLWAFCRQAFRYGKGRARQMKVYPCLSDLVHLIPALFLVYLASLFVPLFMTSAPWAAWLSSMPWRLPLFLFVLLALGTGISAASWHRRLGDLLGVPVLIFLRQVFYGLGLMAGLLSPSLKPDNSLIQLFKAAGKPGRAHLKPVTVRGER